MARFRASTKAEAGKQLALIKEEILDTSSKLNCMDLIPLLLRFEDAINNLEISCISGRVGKELLEYPNLHFSTARFINEWYKVINDCIIEISDNGLYMPPEATELPEFSFGICFQPNLDDYLLEAFEKGDFDKNDLIIRKPRMFLNEIPGWFFIAVRGSFDTHVEDNINSILNLRDILYKKGLLETMIFISPDGTEVEFDDSTGLRRITLPKGITAKTVLEQQGLTPRLIETYTMVYDWNSYFRQVAMESIKVASLGKGEKNLKNLKKEDEEIYRAYSSIKDYPKTFRDFYGMKLKEFFYIISGILYLCYDEIHTVGWWKYSNLSEENRLNRKFNSELINQTIQLLSNPSESKKRYDGFIILGDNVLTNFRRLSIARIMLLEKCFSEVFNNDLKGKSFEKACRQLLRDEGLKTLSERVDILEPMISPEISYSLWGKQKQRTDIDIVSSRDNNVLIIECKEIKSSRLKLRQQKQFKKYLIEHFYKTQWILENFKKFETYVGNDLSDLLSIDREKPLYLFPILVTNRLVDIEEIKGALLITYLELKEILSSKALGVEDSSETVGTLEFEIRGRKIALPWMSRIIESV